MRVHRLVKRPFLLLEVLIAFFIIALCAVPLMTPQIYMLKSEMALTREIELDRAVNILYADLLEEFYDQGVNWSMVGTKASPKDSVPIGGEVFERLGYGVDYLKRLGFEGSYSVRVKRSKQNKEFSKPKKPPDQYLYHLLEVQYKFKPLRWVSLDLAKGDSLTYTYDLFVQRRPKEVGTENVQ